MKIEVTEKEFKLFTGIYDPQVFNRSEDIIRIICDWNTIEMEGQTPEYDWWGMQILAGRITLKYINRGHVATGYVP